MAVQAEGQGLDSLEQEKGVEGGDGRPGVPQQDGPDVGGQGGGTGGVREADPVVAGVGRPDGGEAAGGLPVKCPPVHNDPAQGGAVAPQKLGGGVDHHVGPVLDGADEVGGAEGVVHHQGDAVAVGDGGDGVQIGEVAVGVAQGLQVDRLGVGADGPLHLRQVVGVHKGGGDPEGGQGVGQQVIGAAVDGLLGHDVVPRLGQGLDGIGDGGGAGGHRQGGASPLQGGHPPLQHLLGGVGEAAVDVARLLQGKAGGSVGGVREDVGGGLIDRDRPGAGGRVGVLLSGVELESLKVIGGVLGHGKHPFCIWEVGGRGEINPAPEYVGQYTIENQLSQWVIEKKSVPP